MPYLPNPGHLPDECVILDEDGQVTGFRKCHVRLRNGYDSCAAGAAPWPSFDNRQPRTRWKQDGRPHPFDILEYEIA